MDYGANRVSRNFDYDYGNRNIHPLFLGCGNLIIGAENMNISDHGFSSMAELLENKFYQEKKEYHTLKDAKTSIDMNYLQSQVRQMAKDRKKE